MASIQLFYTIDHRLKIYSYVCYDTEMNHLDLIETWNPAVPPLCNFPGGLRSRPTGSTLQDGGIDQTKKPLMAKTLLLHLLSSSHIYLYLKVTRLCLVQRLNSSSNNFISTDMIA